MGKFCSAAAVLALILSCHGYPDANQQHLYKRQGQAHSYDTKTVQQGSSGFKNAADSQQKFWWQGPNSPFNSGAAQLSGVSAGAQKTQHVTSNYHSSSNNAYSSGAHSAGSCCQQQQQQHAAVSQTYNAAAPAVAPQLSVSSQPVPAAQPHQPAVVATAYQQQQQQQNAAASHSLNVATQQLAPAPSPVAVSQQAVAAATAFQQQQQIQQSFQGQPSASPNVVDQAPSEPYPGCAAALKCVKEEFCDIEGTMVNTPVFLTPQQKEYRVPLMSCRNPDNNEVGFCCRDPLYQDPWPADMPMPGMGNAKPIPQVQPSVVEPQPQQIQTVICSQQQECVPRGVCAFRWQGDATRNSPACRSPVDGNIGVCCNRLPPPPQQPPVVNIPAPVPVPQPLPPAPQPQPSIPQPLPPVPQPLPPVPQPQPSIPQPLPPVPQPAAPSVPQPLPPALPQPAPQPVPAPIGAGFADCGIPGPSSELPWHGIVASENGKLLCSAALVGGKFAVTAAHCVRGTNPSSLRLHLGQTQVGPGVVPYRQEAVAAVVTHPDFQEGSLFNDIALVLLKNPALPDANLNRICLPASAESFASDCYVTGWDKGVLTGSNPVGIQKAQVTLVQNRNCEGLLQKTHLGKYFKLHQSFTCAVGQDYSKVCKVDSGSPLICKKPNTQQYVLAGVSSWSASCDNLPGVYTNVENFANWLQSEINRPENEIVTTSNNAFQTQQQFQAQFSSGAGYGR